MSSNSESKLILITNDDGIAAKGLRHLIECVSLMGEVIAVAPEGHRSGQSSAITVDTPLRITQHPDYHGAKMYAVNGTPVDCLKLAMHAIVPRRPDIVLSGINHGSNSGNAVIYSGTMGAVMEACFLGVPAVGYSLVDNDINADLAPTTPFVLNITERVLHDGLPEGICLNVNIPAHCIPEGIKVVRAARGYWTDEYFDAVDPHGRPFYWLTGHFVNIEPDDLGTDEYWLSRQYVTVVPVRPDQSATDAIPAIDSMLR